MQVSINVAAPLLEKALNEALPSSMGEQEYNFSVDGGADQKGGISLGYNVTRDKATVTPKGTRVAIDTRLSYWIGARGREWVTPPAIPCPVVDGHICTPFFPVCLPRLRISACQLPPIHTPLVYGSCGKNGESLRRIDMTLSTGLALTPEWSVSLTPTIDRLDPLDRCQVVIPFVEKFNATGRVRDAFKDALTKEFGSINAKVSEELLIEARVRQAWKDASMPIQLGESQWLTINPTRVASSTPTFTDRGMDVSLTLEALPMVTLGSEPKAATSTLPKLEAALPGNMFYVPLPVFADHAYIDTQVQGQIGDGLTVPLGDGNSIRVTSVTVSSVDTRAVVSVKIRGRYSLLRDFELTGFLVGTPHVDAVQQTVTMPDLDFTIETHNLLVKLANLFAHDTIRDELRRRLVVDVAPLSEKARGNLREGLNRQAGVVRLTGTVNDLRLIGLTVVHPSRQIRADIIAQGSLAASVQEISPEKRAEPSPAAESQDARNARLCASGVLRATSVACRRPPQEFP
ncbi:DUF4403 family protein [Caenimonas sedimenti]|uniref:DUF4403 family protein n=1 Tax=Caenimonas sedimenti TaxID=2596921 RepID=UPI00164938A0|nr:DUF4403 family protein [Caenimonas sedimenti]